MSTVYKIFFENFEDFYFDLKKRSKKHQKKKNL